MKNSNNSDRKLINSLASTKDAIGLFKKIPINRQGFILLRLSDEKQENIIKKLETKEVIKILHYLDLEQVVDLLQCLKEEEKDDIIRRLNEDLKSKVKFLLRFNPGSAAGLMNFNYIEVDKSLKIKDVLKMVKDYEKKRKRFPEILVVDSGYLLGELEGQSLFSDARGKVEKHVKKVPSIKYNKEEKEVIGLFERNPHKQVVVLNEDKSIMGIIYSDDVLRIIGKHKGDDLYSFAGIQKRETALDGPLMKVKNRYKWLILNLFTAFLAASVVSLFRDTISTFVILAAYMPIVAGMGGNAGTQTLAVIVRGLALKEVDPKAAKSILVNEMIAGAINGIIVGVLVAIVATFINNTPILGLIIGIAMITNLFIAGLFGTFIPLLMMKLGKDPASSASIFITTATDVFGFFVFLGLATILL